MKNTLKKISQVAMMSLVTLPAMAAQKGILSELLASKGSKMLVTTGFSIVAAFIIVDIIRDIGADGIVKKLIAAAAAIAMATQWETIFQTLGLM